MNRRNFLSNAALAGAGSALSVTPLLTSCAGGDTGKTTKKYTPEELGMFSFVDIAPDGKPLKAALIGCGDRGTGAATQFLKSGPNVSVTALADVFPDSMDRCRNILKEKSKIEVVDANCFLGFDAYKKVMEMPDIDVVLLCTPDHFRPEHFRSAVEAGKHVFMEKSCAIDPVGVRTVLASAKIAKQKGLTVIAGTQRRHSRAYWEAYIQVRNGLIGDIVSGSAHWDSGVWWSKHRRPEWNDMEYCIRNWPSMKWMSGDIPLGFVIHNIDIVTWFMGMHPARAVAFGSRAQCLTGDVYDFFSIDYYYENNKKMLATNRLIDGTETNVSEQIYGTKGMFTSRDGIRLEDYNGNLLWKYDYEANPEKNHYDQEHIHLVESIRLNKKINQAEGLAYSSLIAILGREAAYTGKSITWDEILNSPLRYGPETYEFGKLDCYEEGVIPKPGVAPKQPD